MSNRNYKDSVFVDLFSKDLHAKENFISLYNALHRTNLDPVNTEVKPVMLEKVLYMKYYNDISMLIDGKIVVMIEHQSTVNENMPFRFLEYIARVYEKITPTNERFGRKQIKLPKPEFYVFYNGIEDFPLEKELYLSDAFIYSDEESLQDTKIPLEITVKVVNINIGKDNPILRNCETLAQYSKFIEEVRTLIKEGHSDPLSDAITQSIKNGILSEYLERKSKEVRNMLLAEYDYDTDIAVQRKEAYDDGLETGRKQGIERGIEQEKINTAKKLLSMGLSIEQISEGTGLALEQVKKLQE